MIPYIFSCTAPTVAVTDALGWKSAQVAEDNLIDLPQLAFKGKKWQDIRTALNKGPKEGIEFRMVTLADESWSLVRQVEELSQEWLGDKKLARDGLHPRRTRPKHWIRTSRSDWRWMPGRGVRASPPGCRCTAATA